MTAHQSYALAGRIQEFIEWDANRFENNMVQRFQKFVGERPSIKQQAAWRGSWSYIRDLFLQLPLDFYAAFEYRLPASQQRVDLLLLGSNQYGEKIAVVLELKGWRKLILPETDINHYLVIADGERHIHPALQTADYIGKLRYTHSEACHFLWYGSAWLYNLKPISVDLSDNQNFGEIDIKLFFSHQIDDMASWLTGIMNSGISDVDARMFLDGIYCQTMQLFQAIRDNGEALKKGALEALTAQGFAPAEEQIQLIDRILEAVKKGTPSVFLIDGEPGSGKTYLATLLLIKALSMNKQAVLGFRNNRLINAVRSVFRHVKPGLDGSIKFFSTGYGNGLAEYKVQTPDFDLIIYDEAQRLAPSLANNAIKRGIVTVFFYDSGQILNVEELESVQAIENAARNSRRLLSHEHLSHVYRVRGGRAYHHFVENLLKKPYTIGKNKDFPDYEFRVFYDITDMIKALEIKRDHENAHVALVAAFTESPGDRKNKSKKTINNRRIGFPLYSNFNLYKEKNLDIYWLMDEKTQYPQFWIERESNKLTHCASIYGCQGFEADFVGVIWGRDFILRHGQWVPGTACEDTIGKPSLKNLIKKRDSRSILLLENRYRIFLTRGIRGTFVFCEDEETAQFLIKL
ncbi:MAG: DUF2075 domain-containing protein [Calditrichaeota bacterium]|nr:MAG: DUF2075 domain-containing protein [Calditrichota bacterium]